MQYSKFLFLIGIILFGFLLWSLGAGGIQKIGEIFINSDKAFLAFGLLLLIPQLAIKGIKQAVLLTPFGKKISLKESCEVWLAGYLLGSISPGRSGDFLRAVYFQKNFGIKLGNGLSAVLIDRIFDVGFLLMAGIAGLIYLSLLFRLDSAIIILLSVFLVLFIIAFFLITKKKIARFFAKPLFRFVPHRFKEKIRSSFHEFYEGLVQYGKAKKPIISAALLTIAAWVLTFVQFYIFALALGLNVSFMLITAITPVITLVEIIPISFSGIGTRDFTLVGLLGLAGFSPEAAVSFSMMILLTELILAFFGIFFVKKVQALPKKKP